MPIQPTAHYAMGGIPTDIDGRVVLDAGNGRAARPLRGRRVRLRSVHGANRLGTNSLVDLVVFGRRGGEAMAEFCREAELPRRCPPTRQRRAASELERIRTNKGTRRPRQAARGDAGRDDGRRRHLPRRPRGWRAALDKVRELQAPLPAACGLTTRASASTPTCWRPGSWAACSTWPRSTARPSTAGKPRRAHARGLHRSATTWTG